MSSTEKSFKVLIAGGGIAGLVLAHMLERFNIDYLLLESHGEIDPTIGASIGILPNGARILDQLDLYEPIAKLDYKDKRATHIHKENGDCLLNVPRFHDHIEQRHGYQLTFIDRQWFLRVLYDRLRNKNCVLLNKKVDRVELLDRGVKVFTADGQSFRGSLLIGADGVHSTVRREMFRIADEQAPEYLSTNEQGPVSCHYLCSFGIAQDVPGWEHGSTYTTVGTGHSQLVISGPGNRIYWFFFSRLPETKYGKDIPRSNQEMEAEFVDKYKHAPITKTLTFGQLYAKRLITTLTPLHEYVHEKWFFKRILMMGDSAHKLNPISGQGGNAAIESAAELMNFLLDKKNSQASGLNDLDDEDIVDIFKKTQARRYERARQLVSGAHRSQSLAAFEKPLLSKVTWEYIMKAKRPYAYVDRFGEPLTGSTRLKYLPIKRRPRVIPYVDELPAQPLKQGRRVQIAYALWMAYFAFTAYRLSPKSWTNDAATQRTSYSSIEKQADMGFQALYNFYYLSNLISPITIYLVEGYRLGHGGTILALPSLYLLAAQTQGIALISPIYAILSAFLSTPRPTKRFVKLEVARAFIPALILGYVLPTMLILSGLFGAAKWATWVPRVYQFAPILVCGLTFCFAHVGRIWYTKHETHKDREQSEFECYRAQDVPILKTTYLSAFILQAVAHIALLVYARDELSALYQSVFRSYWDSNHKSINLTKFFPADLAIAFTTWLIGNIYSIWDLRCFGYIKTRDGVICALSVVAGQILVGPGASWAGLWHWREGVIAGLQMN